MPYKQEKKTLSSNPGGRGGGAQSCVGMARLLCHTSPTSLLGGKGEHTLKQSHSASLSPSGILSAPATQTLSSLTAAHSSLPTPQESGLGAAQAAEL